MLIFGDLQISDFREIKEIKEFKDKVISKFTKFPKNETTNTKKHKIMKRLFLLLALCGMVAVGCTEGAENEIPDDAYITLNKEVLTFVPDGESVEVKVCSNYEWTLTNNCDWVTTSISGGEASEEGTAITLTADLTYDDREGTITFSCGKAKKLLVVSQSFKEAIIADENNTFNLNGCAQSINIAYQTNVECEVVIPEEAKSWISLAPATRALVKESATLNIAENNTGADRSVVVKVVAANNSELVAEYTITQAQRYYIEYTSTDGYTITPYSSAFDATIIRNKYIDGKGYIDFNAPITSIGVRAFYDCTSLTSITIPDGVTSIGDAAFLGCTSLTSVTIGNGVKSIGGAAFSGCDSLTSITIPDSVTSIGISAFYGCSGLKSFKGKYASSDGRCLIKDGELISFTPCGLTQYTIPDSVTSIRVSTFRNCTSLTSITIPDSVTSIGDCTFWGCNSLTSVTIGDSVTSIGGSAFERCDSLTSVYITDIAAWCNISFGNNVSNPLSYAENLYLNNELVTDLIIPDGATKIGSYAFYCYDSLTSVTIPDSVTSIGDYAFFSCDWLTSVTIGNGVTEIGDYAFVNCFSLRSVTIGNGVTSIGNDAFRGCISLTSVTIPDSVTSIGDYAFFSCDWLTSVTIPDSVKSIGSEAFFGCDSLKEVYCKPTTPPTGGDGMFYGNASGRTIYVPLNSVSAYKSASFWSDYASAIVGYDF